MPTPELNGIIGACLTPFDDQGRVDYDAMAREIDFIVADADAVSIAAVEAAEYTVLTLEERKELMRRGVELVDHRRPIILGISSPAIRTSVELADYAAQLGADYVQLLMPLRPWGGQPTTQELYDYFGEIAVQCPLPIVAYHNPGPGADPTIEATIRLSTIPKIHAFKESSRDITKISRLIEEIEVPKQAHYFTTMQPLLITLMLGGSGATMPPPGTRIGAQVVRAFRAGDLEHAKEWQRIYSMFPGRWGSYGLPPVMKSAMKHLGIDLGDPSRPYEPVSPWDHALIGDFLRKVGLLE
jgi:4-hydroxy-tetrahydrodipicolinate synthase